MLVDNMDDAVNQAFAAWPERMYIIHEEKIVYKGGPGPFEFDVEEAKEALSKVLANE